ncbi:MAG: HD domain-containing protein [Desulfitobacteriaceae bacterium]
MFYRIKQFYKALFPSISPLEIEWVAKTLPASAFSIFRKQSLPEQRHALDVTKSLAIETQSLALNPDEYQNLIFAALLHDCGKSLIQLHLWQRVLIVLFNVWPLQLKENTEAKPGYLSSTLNIAHQHAEWGESLAKEAGLNQQICLLIRQHHSPQTKLGKLLQKNDNKH